MKKLKKLLSVIIAMTVILGTIAVPVSAEVTSPYDAAMFLKDKNLLQGDDDGDLMLDEELKREQMIVILSRLAGVEDMAKEFPTDEMTFKDVPEYSDYAPYIAWAQAEGITQGYSKDKFGFGDELTGWQTKAFFVRAVGYTSTSDTKIESKAKELGITKDSIAASNKPITRLDMSLLMYNTLYAKTSEGGTLGEKIGVGTGTTVVTPDKKLELTASLGGSNIIKVKFNRAVTDTSKLTFEVKGTINIGCTPAWGPDKTEVTLTTYSSLFEGIYTVKAYGDTFEAGKDTATIVVPKNGVGRIEFTNTKLVKDPSHDTNYRATIKYKVYDNYNADVTRTTTESDLSVFATRNLNNSNPFDLNMESGIMTLYFTSPLTTNDNNISVTVLSLKNSITASQVFSVADPERVDMIVFKGTEYQQSTPAITKLLTGKSVAGFITIEAFDQYGGSVNLKSAIDNDILFIKESALILTTEEYTDTTGNRKLRLVVNTTGVTTGRVITLTAVSKYGGKTSSTSLDIKDSNKADRIIFGTQEKLFAAKDPAETFALPITVLDQYGTQLSADEVITNVDNGNLIITSDGGFPVEVARTGINKGKLVNKDVNSTQGTHVITAITRTGGSATYTVDAKEQAYETAIRVNTTPASNLLMGAVTKLNYKFTDQYGRDVKNPNPATVVHVEVVSSQILKATIGGVSTSDADRIIETYASVAAADNAVAVTTVTSDGSSRIIGRLYRNGSPISTIDSSFSVTRGVPSSLNFEIADIPVLPAMASDGLVNGTDKYARPIILTAKDGYGNAYAIPADRVMAISSTDTNLIAVSPTTITSPLIKAQDGYFVVAAKAETTAFGSSDPATKTAVIKAIVSTDNGIKEVVKTVTVAKEDPKTVKVVFADKDLRVGYPYTLDPDAREIADISGTTAEIGNQKIFIFEVDQYGVYTKANSALLRVANIDKFTEPLVYNSSDNTLDFNQVQIKANEPVFVMYLSSNGVYNQFSIKASNGTRP